MAVETTSLEELDAGSRAALVDLVGRMASCKHLLGQRFAQWCTGAPTLEGSVAAASMAQEELGHSRVFSGVARGMQENEAGEQTGTDESLAPEVLRAPFGGWLDYVAAARVADTAVTILLEAAADCSFAPLRQRVRKALDEEEFHGIYARSWADALLAEGGPVERDLRARLDSWRVSVDAWLAPCEADAAALGPLGIRPTKAREELRRRLAG